MLGIEDLKEGPRPIVAGAGSGGAAGQSGTAGVAGNDSGGSGGSDPSGGSAGNALGAAGSEAVPPEVLPDGGVPEGGVVGSGIVVAGRVIDFFRRPVPDTPVTIGGTTAVTDAQGQFSISGVEPPYTAALVINMIRGGGQARYGYRYEGLTRADPTLQVYSALTERSTTSLSVSFENDFPDGLYAIVAFGSPDGRFVEEETTSNTEFLGSPAWTGPVSIGGNIHALRAGRDVSDGQPVAFEAHQTFPLTVTDGQPASAAFDLTATSLTVGAIAGSVSGGAFDTQSNYAGLRFGDGTALPIVNDTPDLPENFLYFVPELEDSSFFVAASDGSSGFPPYGVTHKENIEFGASDIALALPRPVTLTSPPDGGAVTAATPYVWSTLSQTAQTFLWHLEFNTTYEGMFVLTSRTQIELPEFEGLTITPGLGVTWSVETHGDGPSVDALTGPDGYLDAYSLGTAFPIGPNRSDGYYRIRTSRLHHGHRVTSHVRNGPGSRVDPLDR